MSTAAPASPTVTGWNRHLRLAWRDIGESYAMSPLWVLMARNDITHRYRRSLLGPFWLTLSTGVMILVLGVVYSFLFHISLRDYLPFLTAGQVFWTYLSTTLLDSCQAFIDAEGYLKQIRIPKLALMLRVLLRNILVLLHNLLIVALVWAIFQPPMGLSALLVVPALLLSLIAGLAAGTILAMICARFRDMPQIITNLIQMMFFVTPVMWRVGQMPADKQYLVHLNPAASFIALLRDPLLGQTPPPELWMEAGGVTLALVFLAFFFFARYRARIPYWV